MPAATEGKASEVKDFLSALADAGHALGGSTEASAGTATPTPSAPGAAAGTASTGSAGSVHAAAPNTPTAPTTPPIPIGQVPMTIGLRSLAGSSEFQIRLDPVELGRIDVKLEIDKARTR